MRRGDHDGWLRVEVQAGPGGFRRRRRLGCPQSADEADDSGFGRVLITGSEDGLTIAGFDYDVSSQVVVPAEIASFGTVLVSGGCYRTSRGRCRPSRWRSVSTEIGSY